MHSYRKADIQLDLTKAHCARHYMTAQTLPQLKTVKSIMCGCDCTVVFSTLLRGNILTANLKN